MRLQDVFVKNSTTPFIPPKRFLEDLFRLDNGRLRIRWSEEQQQWCLERKVVRAIQYVKNLPQYKHRFIKDLQQWATFENDSWVRARDGYVLIGYYYPYALKYPDWIIRDIQFNDINKHGGWKKVANLIEAREERKRAQLERDQSWERREWAEDMYEDWQWRQGCRASVPSNYDQIKR